MSFVKHIFCLRSRDELNRGFADGFWTMIIYAQWNLPGSQTINQAVLTLHPWKYHPVEQTTESRVCHPRQVIRKSEQKGNGIGSKKLNNFSGFFDLTISKSCVCGAVWHKKGWVIHPTPIPHELIKRWKQRAFVVELFFTHQGGDVYAGSTIATVNSEVVLFHFQAFLSRGNCRVRLVEEVEWGVAYQGSRVRLESQRGFYRHLTRLDRRQQKEWISRRERSHVEEVIHFEQRQLPCGDQQQERFGDPKVLLAAKISAKPRSTQSCSWFDDLEQQPKEHRRWWCFSNFFITA